MAENECLSLAKTPRWFRVYSAVQRGESAEQVASTAFKALHGTIKAVIKRIPFEKLLDAARDKKGVTSELIQQCRAGRDHALLLKSLAEPGVGREALLENYFSAVCDQYLGQIQACAMGKPNMPKAQELERLLNHVRTDLVDKVHRLAETVAGKPSAPPRLPPQRKAKEAASSTATLLNESMLGVRSK